jgi:hypothetical protein
MKVWVTTVQYADCDASVFGVHNTWEGAWAKLNLEFRMVKECRGAGGKCECDFDIKSHHYHGTATEDLPSEKGWVQVGGPVSRKVCWTADEFEVE